MPRYLCFGRAVTGVVQVVGYLEPLPPNEDGSPATGFEFENHIVGSAIPSGYIPSVEKGFREATATGAIIGYPCEARPSPPPRDRALHH